LRSLLFPTLGAALAYWLICDWYLPRFGLGTVERIAALGRHLDGATQSRQLAPVLGNSILMEGIDASRVEASGKLPWSVENFAMSGAGPTEFLVVLPTILKLQPRIVMMGIQPHDLGALVDLPADKAFAYAYAGFVDDWPQSWSREWFPGLSNETYLALKSPPRQRCLHFRRAPVNALNDSVRRRLRSGLRSGVTDEWKSPFELLQSISADRLDFNLRYVRSLIEHRTASGNRDGADEIRRINALCLDWGSRPLFVVLPIHPRLRPDQDRLLEELRQLLASLEAISETGFVDASELLQADDFADAQHPNEAGREKLSAFLGERVARLSGSL
jgi:hypothetical protein